LRSSLCCSWWWCWPFGYIAWDWASQGEIHISSQAPDRFSSCWGKLQQQQQPPQLTHARPRRSGGHTSEMLSLLKPLSNVQYSPVLFVVADTDTSSLVRLEKSNVLHQHRSIHTIPRSREVKQTWLSTVFSTAKALMFSLALVFTHKPHLVLVNGPGTCVPVCLASVLLRMSGLGNPTIIFVESFCRVHSLSLSGRLVRPFADRFIVQWPELAGEGEFVENLY
jgi:beta-1,4-N-acetylglucosaminyltransferase